MTVSIEKIEFPSHCENEGNVPEKKSVAESMNKPVINDAIENIQSAFENHLMEDGKGSATIMSYTGDIKSFIKCVVARVVIKTNESPYVDGMDIIFDRMNDQLTMDSNYYENSPDFMGGTVEDSFKWLQKQGDLIYQQMDDPFENDRLIVEQNRCQE